jgi:hypothetical protein
MSESGTPRRFAAVRKFGRDRSEAAMPRASGAVDLTKMTQSKRRPELAIIRSEAYRISSRPDRTEYSEMTTNVLVTFYKNSHSSSRCFTAFGRPLRAGAD